MLRHMLLLTAPAFSFLAFSLHMVGISSMQRCREVEFSEVVAIC